MTGAEAGLGHGSDTRELERRIEGLTERLAGLRAEIAKRVIVGSPARSRTSAGTSSA